MRHRFAILLCLLVACSFESAPSVATVDNGCDGDADCEIGACDGNICIDASGASIDLAIEVVGSSPEARRAIPASWAFGAERIVGPSMRDLVLPATREVRGTVRWDEFRVPATVRFVRRMASAVEPLQPVPVEVDTLREPAGAPESEAYDFSVVLVAGETYDVSVIPTSIVTSSMDASASAIGSFPPLYLEALIEGGDPAEPLRFDVSFPADLDSECASTRRTSCTLTADVVSFDGEVELAEAGLQVRALDQSNGHVVSSIGTTDSSGRFSIRIGDETPDYLIRVTSSVVADPFPAVSVDPSVVFVDDPAEKVVRIPRLTSVQYTGRVRDKEGTAVPGATVRFLSNSVFDDSQLGLQGSFSTSVTTNEDGSFGAELLPGFYAVTVTPPDDLDSSWGVLSSEAVVGEENSVAEALIVPSKLELSGTVETFKEEAVSGAAVLARARLDGELGSKHRSQEAVSDSLGGFTLRMDRGLYDVHVKLSSTTGYAWLVEPALAMDQAVTRTYRLNPPIPIEGLVQASDGTILPGALIRAYVLEDDGTSKHAVQVAETMSDEEGSYRLLIAPNFGDE